MHWQLIGESSFWLFKYLDNVWPITQMILGIGLIIFVHELGHFLAAKACGVKCEKFYIGFDAFDLNLGVFTIPRRLFYFNWGETEYGIGILPLGGYVRMLGQHDNPAEAEAERERAQKDGQLNPRSYMAKSVPQRMLIISAGVIMNIIFGIIFATIAFYNGVQYQPPSAGSVIAGSPAWENNLSDLEISKVNGISTNDRYYSFMHLIEATVIGGADSDVNLEFERSADSSQTETLSIKPKSGMSSNKTLDIPRLGVNPMFSLRLGSDEYTIQSNGVAKNSNLKPKDRVTHFNGEELASGSELLQKIRSHWNEEVELTVVRGEDEEKGIEGTTEKVKISPNPMRHLGLVLKYGEISGIQKNSPADLGSETGEKLQIGDRILALDGKPIHPTLFSYDLRRIAKKSGVAKLTILRKGDGDKDGKEMDISLKPRIAINVVEQSSTAPLAIEELGIVMPLANVVDRVVEGSPADGKFQPGDEIISFEETIQDEDQKKEFGGGLKPKSRIIKTAWPYLIKKIQNSGTRDSTFSFKVKRGKEEVSINDLKTTELESYFCDTRGFSLLFEQQKYVSPNLTDAFKTGVNQTFYDANKVLRFLTGLVTGKIPITTIGGLPSITMAATSEAKQGLPRLLLFLTLLSANLAVINFLPIPILDGGHMVFLAWEGITGRPPNEKVQEGLSIAGALLILALMVFSFGLDFFRIFTMFSG